MVLKKGIRQMGKKKQNLKTDIVLKNYWSNNEQFADLFNAVLFDRKSVIRPEKLEKGFHIMRDKSEDYVKVMGIF